MPVYVDQLFTAPAVARKNWRYGKSCHLIADSIDELKTFALSIGMRAEWFQPESSPHFDLTEGRRAAAIRSGAIELDRRAFVEKIQELRSRRSAGDKC